MLDYLIGSYLPPLKVFFFNFEVLNDFTKIVYFCNVHEFIINYFDFFALSTTYAYFIDKCVVIIVKTFRVIKVPQKWFSKKMQD